MRVASPVPTLLVATCLLAALAPSALVEAQAAPSRDQVRAMLSGVEDVPTDAEWARLGEGALPVLVTLYDDTREAPYIRLRALSAAAAFPTAATRTFLLAVAGHERSGDLFVRAAVLAMARGFGARAVPDVSPFLEHDEPVVRRGAATALGRIGGPAALEALRDRRSREREPSVRVAIDRALR